MTDNIISLSDRRRRREESDDRGGLIYCPCGDAWWGLRDGAVCFAEDQRVTGWTGTPYCKSCGKMMGSKL